MHHWSPPNEGGSAEYTGVATYYSEPRCDPTAGGYYGADGTHVYEGMVANSVLPLGTRIWVQPAILGKHEFTVHDRFGSSQEAGRLDVWMPCGTTIPNPTERFHIMR